MEFGDQKKLELRYAARVMQRFSGIYGAGVVKRKYSDMRDGEDVGMAAAIEAFAIALYPLRDRLDLIAYGVANVNAEFPEFIPNPHQFYELCLRGKRQEFKELPPAKSASPEVVAKAKAVAGRMNERFANKDWANKLYEKWIGGEKILPAVVMMAESALGFKFTKESCEI